MVQDEFHKNGSSVAVFLSIKAYLVTSVLLVVKHKNV
jgi:hypothetical protein